MAKVKGTNRRTRQKRSYTKPGSKRGRALNKLGKNNPLITFFSYFQLFLTVIYVFSH